MSNQYIVYFNPERRRRELGKFKTTKIMALSCNIYVAIRIVNATGKEIKLFIQLSNELFFESPGGFQRVGQMLLKIIFPLHCCNSNNEVIRDYA